MVDERTWAATEHLRETQAMLARKIAMRPKSFLLDHALTQCCRVVRVCVVCSVPLRVAGAAFPVDARFQWFSCMYLIAVALVCVCVDCTSISVVLCGKGIHLQFAWQTAGTAAIM